MSIRQKNSGGDALTDVLDTLRIEGRVFYVGNMRSPWAIEETSRQPVYFYYIESGTGDIRFQLSEKVINFESGDLLLIVGGEVHLIYNHSVSDPFSTDHFFNEKSNGIYSLKIDGGSKLSAKFICGAFSFRYPDNRHLISVLPPLIHIKADSTRPEINFRSLLDLLSEESRIAGAGSGAVVNRLSEIIFALALRIWIKDQDAGDAGWLSALKDDQIGYVLSLIHQNPEKKWTLSKMASETGMSNNDFSREFKRLVGVTPINYLSGWRMNLAFGYLRSGEFNVTETAVKIGYETGPNFGRYFKKIYGIVPSKLKPE